MALLVPALGYWAWTARLLPLAEYRDWIVYRGQLGMGHLIGMLVRSNRASGMTLIYANFTGRMCGSSLPCLNTTSLAPLMISLPLMFLLARRLHVPRAWGVFAALCWIGSAAVF